jgi:hypothetical protein
VSITLLVSFLPGDFVRVPVRADQVLVEHPGDLQRDVVVIGAPQQVQALFLPLGEEVSPGQQGRVVLVQLVVPASVPPGGFPL